MTTAHSTWIWNPICLQFGGFYCIVTTFSLGTFYGPHSGTKGGPEFGSENLSPHCGETAFATQIGALDTTQYWEPSNDLHFRWPTSLWMTPSMMAVMSGVTLFITAVDSDKWIDTTHNLVVLKTHIRIITILDHVAPRFQDACSNTLTPVFRIHVMTQNAYFPNLLTP